MSQFELAGGEHGFGSMHCPKHGNGVAKEPKQVLLYKSLPKSNRHKKVNDIINHNQNHNNHLHMVRNGQGRTSSTFVLIKRDSLNKSYGFKVFKKCIFTFWHL